MPEMNASQRRAVNFHDGALLLQAGPGSGKTTVLTHRIKALIQSGVKDSDILVITFTRAAALEMKERFDKLMAPVEANASFGTFHAIFYSILRHHRAYRKVVPITDKDKIRYMKRALEISGLTDECKDFDDIVRSLGFISACKNNGSAPEEFHQDMYSPEAFRRLFEAYNGLLHDFGLIDFDDMVGECLKLLKSDSDFCRLWQKRFKYILIDEFQDISVSQYELVKLLAYPEYNVFAVGDDDQSIYAFRGANVALMRRFLTEISGASQDVLSVNYRSTREIVSAAGVVISENKDRFNKTITARDGMEELKDSVRVDKCPDKNTQTEKCVEIIKERMDEGIKPDEIALLVRTNRQGAEYAGYLRAVGIETAYNDNRVPFTSVYIRDICSYMAIAAGDHARANYLNIVNKPLRYIRRDSMSDETVSRDMLMRYYAPDAHMIRRIDEMYRHFTRIRGMSPQLALRYICNTVGYDRYVRETVTADKYKEYLEEKEAFLSLIRGCGSYREVDELLSMIRDDAVKSSKRGKEEHGVHIMTYHGSKGLEFDTVILPDVNENRIPSRSAHTAADIEEERRMFYVAMTRAKKYLYLLYRADDGLRPSRFIEKLR